MKGNFKIFAMKTLKAYLFIGSIPFVVGSLPLESESNPESYNFDQTCSDVCIENYFMLPPIVNVSFKIIFYNFSSFKLVRMLQK